MKLYTLNPLVDGRWDELAEAHPQASVFHQRWWLETLERTYGYQPLALTSAAPEEALKDGIVLCQVSSWMTGRRLVSLPFSDHCDLLVDDDIQLQAFMDCLGTESESNRYRYVELRPRQFSESEASFQKSGSYCLHTLDVRPLPERIFSNFHKDSIQRKVRRAEREGLTDEWGTSEHLLKEFYRLLVMTRRRHRLLPQPPAWFRNLMAAAGDRAEIGVARKDGVAIAAMLTLRHRSCVVYKYGGSDERSHNLGGMPWLFWRLIERSKRTRAEAIDLGRSDWDQTGLITFKDRLGASRTSLSYYRNAPVKAGKKLSDRNPFGIRALFPALPQRVLSVAGGMLYRHIG